MAINLASIGRASLKAPRIIIHGDAGLGKTTFACSAPAPIVIQTEDGLGQIEVDAFPLARSYDEVMQAIASLYDEDHKYETLVVDSLDWLEPLVWEKTCRVLGVDSIEAPGYGKGYVEASMQWREFFAGVTALRDHKGMAVIMTAHSQIIRVEDPILPPYDRHDLKLHKRASAIASEYADAVLFATWKTHVVKDEAGFNKKHIRAVTSGDRIMHTIGQPAFLAKNRMNLDSPLPLSWGALMQAIQPTAQAA